MKEVWLLPTIAGLLMLGVLWAQQPVIAEEKIDPYNCTMTVLCKFLEAILEEEKKQTALLDHMDCRNNYYYLRDVRNYCGEPLNYTGVWKP